jgi:hypothetical protein
VSKLLYCQIEEAGWHNRIPASCPSRDDGLFEIARHLVGSAFLSTPDALAGHAQRKSIAVSRRGPQSRSVVTLVG